MRVSKFLSTVLVIVCPTMFQPLTAVPQASKSVDHGISATANAIQQIDRVITQNEEDLSKLFADQGFKFMKAAGGEGLEWIKLLESGYSGFQAGKDINAGRYAEALMEVAKIITDVWGEVDPNVKLGKAGVEVAADVYEAQSLLRQQAQLLGTRLQLEKQYYRLLGKRGLDLTQIDKIQVALDQDAELHKRFLDSLKQYNLSRQDVTAKALKNASTRPSQGYQVGSGMVVDPQEDVDALAAIPGINPDFIESLRKQFALLERGDLRSVKLAGMINKYDYNTPNWTYINIFGPGRGREITASKTSHSRWDTLNPYLAGRGTEGISYFPSFDRASKIYVVLLVTQSQVDSCPDDCGIGWNSGLFSEDGTIITYDRWYHNRNQAPISVGTELSSSHQEAIDEKGRKVRTQAGERIYTLAATFGLELPPGTYVVRTCPPYRPLGRSSDYMGIDETGECRTHTDQAPQRTATPLQTFKVNISRGMSATVTVKTY